MIKEAYCSFEVSKILKEKGFDEPTWTRYEDDNEVVFGDKYDWNSRPMGQMSAPTHQMACKWLREVHDIYIDISIYAITKNIVKYNINVYYKKHKNDSMYFGIHLTKECSKYEEAVELALKYTLENLI